MWPATRHSWLLGSRTSWQLYLWRGHYGDQGMYGILTLRLGSVLGFQGSGQRVQGSRYSLLVVYPVTGHPVGEANYLAVEGQGPVAHLQVLLASTGSRTRLTDSHSTTSPNFHARYRIGAQLMGRQDIAHLESQYSWAQIRLAAYSQGSRPSAQVPRPFKEANKGIVLALRCFKVQGLIECSRGSGVEPTATSNSY